MITVVYIMGYGRSGSTLLTVLLGDQPGVVGCGEVNKLWGQVWPNDEYCGCGQPASMCAFWSEVRKTYLAHPDAGSPDRCLTRHRQFGGIRHWGRVHRLMRGANREFERYTAQIGALYSAIASLSGHPVIVDSSKCPTWGLVLQSVPGIDVRYIHLTRDVRSVFNSLQTPYVTDAAKGYQKTWSPPSAIRTALAWSVHNRYAEKTSRGSLHQRRVACEDLVKDPVGTVQDMAAHLDIDLGSVLKKVAESAPLQPGCVIAGNAMRMEPAVTLRQGPAKRPELSLRDERVLSTLARPALRRYGYTV